jgi:pimeloyl-ACP methyl ester carboxylesterase
MAVFVFVHGGDVSTETWNRLSRGAPVHTANGRLGGRVWETVTPELRANGHTTFAPTLIDEHNCNLHGHIEQVCLLIAGHNLKDITLVGHSYGGMVITGVASLVPESIRRLVYLDAAIPVPGESLFDLLAQSGQDPLVSIPGLEPAMAYVDKLRFDPEKVQHLEKVFIRCTKSELAGFITVSLDRIARVRERWTLLDLPAGHVCQPTHPGELARILLDVAGKDGGP